MPSTGKSWLGIATRPIAAITEVSPISSGTPAATSEPKVIMRMIRVIGSESIPAFPRSSLIVSLIALLALAPPNCSTTHVGMLGLDRGGRREAGSTRSLASIESPAISKLTSAAWPSAVTSASPSSGDFTFSTYWSSESRPVDVLDRGLELGIVERERVALDQDDLLDRPQAGVVERLLGACDSPVNWSRPVSWFVPTGCRP